MGDAPAPKPRHPVGLYVLFFVEMWERFGFYCMEADFVYYMQASRYEYLRDNASFIYGLFLGCVYFSPFFGGLLSEWRLGYTLAIGLGGFGLAAGYGLLSLEPAVCFVFGLACIVVGNGLFKPNISSMVGKLYPQGDPRIDSAFTIFYMGINVGALFAPLTAAALSTLMKPDPEAGLRYAYLATFAVAAAGMVLGEVIFFTFRRHVRLVQDAAARGAATESAAEAPADLQRKRYVALLIFFGINVLFWMAFKQKGNLLAVWARDRTDLAAPDWLATALSWVHLDFLWLKDGLMAKELFAALNPFYVILFSPLLVWFWNVLRRGGLDVPTPAKLVLGFALTAGAFAIMWRVAVDSPGAARVTPLALVACYAVLTLGELCLSPMGLSLVSKLAPGRTRAVWMGLFMASIAVGGYMAGYVIQVVKEWATADKFLLLTGSSLFAMLLMVFAYPVIAAALRPAPNKGL